jgi:hypothetical protein
MGMTILSITLPTVIVDVRVRHVMFHRLLKGFERFCCVALLHVDAGDLNPALGQRGYQPYRLLEVGLGAIGVSDQKPITVYLVPIQYQWRIIGRTDLKVPRRLSASALPSSHEIPWSMASLTKLNE